MAQHNPLRAQVLTVQQLKDEQLAAAAVVVRRRARDRADEAVLRAALGLPEPDAQTPPPGRP